MRNLIRKWAIPSLMAVLLSLSSSAAYARKRAAAVAAVVAVEEEEVVVVEARPLQTRLSVAGRAAEFTGSSVRYDFTFNKNFTFTLQRVALRHR